MPRTTTYLNGGRRRRHSRQARPMRPNARGRIERLEPKMLLNAAGDDPIALPPAATAMPLFGAHAGRTLRFEPNLGQAANGVDYLARSTGMIAYLQSDTATLLLPPAPRVPSSLAPLLADLTPDDPHDRLGTLVQVSLVGADAQAPGSALRPLGSVSHYLVGNDPAGWQTGVPHYAEVRFGEVYPGIDVVWYSGASQVLEYDFVVSPGVDPGVIRLAFGGVDALAIDDSGALLLDVRGRRLVQSAPVAYQDADGTREFVPAAYLALPDGTLGIELGAFDPGRPLIIDPVLSFSTYFGGSGLDEITDVAVAPDGGFVVSGNTASVDFPLLGGLDTIISGAEAFVARFDSAGTLIYSTFLGGGGDDHAWGLAVDGTGNVYVTGQTSSANFPVLNAFDSTWAEGTWDAFLARLNPQGNALLYSTYLGSHPDALGQGGTDLGRAVAVSEGGFAFVTGSTNAPFFPTTAGAYQTANSGGIRPAGLGRAHEVFVSKFDTTAAGAASLVYSTFVGTTEHDIGWDIAVDATGAAHVAGFTTGDITSQGGARFPTTPGSFQPVAAAHSFKSPERPYDAFAFKLNPAGSALAYSTFLSGKDDDFGISIAVDAQGWATIAGYTDSENYPLAAAYDSSNSGLDAFLTRLDPAGATAAFSTFLGGSGQDRAYAVTVDALRRTVVAGFTDSTDFPLVLPVSGADSLRGGRDAFLAVFSAAGTRLLFSTYHGGSDADEAWGVAADADLDVILGGFTDSSDFPVANALQPGSGGGRDGFISKFTVGALTATLSGRVFDDVDRNRQQDLGESGLSGWTVYLDANEDGELDPGTELSIATAPDGSFLFEDLSPGTYQVRVVVPEGWLLTTPPVGVFTRTLDAGQQSSDNLFGVKQRLAFFDPVPGAYLSHAGGQGLLGSYVDHSLRDVAATDDWRQTQTIAGTRVDAWVNYFDASWGHRQTVGLTHGSDVNWQDFSAQWDGVIEIPADGIRLYTFSDDGSRMWIDINGDGEFDAAELVDNNWGQAQGATLGPPSPPLSIGSYAIRIQYEQGGGPSRMTLFWDTQFARPETEPNDARATADVVSQIDMRLAGNIASAADSDYFRFSLMQGDKLTLFHNRSDNAPQFTVAVELEDAGGSKLAESFDGRRLEFTAPYTGDFYLRLHADQAFGLYVGAYQFDFGIDSFWGILEGESNDVRQTANLIGPQGTLRGTLESAGDADHFDFQAQAGDAVVLRFASPAPASPAARIVDGDGQIVAFNLRGEGLHARLPAAGMYTLSLRPDNMHGTVVGGYLASLMLLPAGTFENEPSRGFSGAAEWDLAASPGPVAMGTLDSLDDSDVFLIDLDGLNYYTFEIWGTITFVELQHRELALYNEFGQLRAWSASGWLGMPNNAGWAGPHYLVIRPTSDLGLGGYAIAAHRFTFPTERDVPLYLNIAKTRRSS